MSAHVFDDVIKEGDLYQSPLFKLRIYGRPAFSNEESGPWYEVVIQGYHCGAYKDLGDAYRLASGVLLKLSYSKGPERA